MKYQDNTLPHYLANIGLMDFSQEYCPEKPNASDNFIGEFSLESLIPLEKEVKELNEKHAVVTTGGKVCILNEDYDPALKRRDISLSSIQDFKHRYSNRKVSYKKPDGNLTSKRLGSFWLDHPERRQYEGIIFSPNNDPNNIHSKYYNLFKGFPIKSEEGDCNLYWKHVHEVICSGNEELYSYVRKWMAHAIQKPSELPLIAIVLRGKQGTGKGVFVEAFGKLFGSHYLSVFSMNQVTGRFNSHMKNLLLLHANEAIWGGDKSAEGALKGLITDPYTPIEFKGKDIISVRNYKRIIVSSNENWAVPIGSDDRRFFVLDVSDAHKEDEDWFKPIIEQMESEGLEALMYDLMNEDLTGFNVRKPPKSGFGFDMKLLSSYPFEQWLYEVLCDGETTFLGKYGSTIKWGSTPEKGDLHQSYRAWCNANKKSHLATQAIFTTNLKKVFPGLGNTKKKSCSGERKLCYKLPSLEESRKSFEKFMKSDSSIWPAASEVIESKDEIEVFAMDIEGDFEEVEY